MIGEVTIFIAYVNSITGFQY